MRYILPIILLIYFSPIFAHAVDEPCFVKGFATIPRQELLELRHSNLKFGELFFQDSINRHFFGGPFGGDRIKTFQLRENSASEGGSGLVKSVFSVLSVGQEKAYQSHYERPGQSEKPCVGYRKDDAEDSHSALLPIVPILATGFAVMMFLIFNSSHNMLLTGQLWHIILYASI
jgi:hypothetical protein